jgi:hypothetical protein
MDLNEARAFLEVTMHPPAREAGAVVLAHLDAIERRAGQVEGGHYMPYARPDEVARWIRTGNREAAASPKAP